MYMTSFSKNDVLTAKFVTVVITLTEAPGEKPLKHRGDQLQEGPRNIIGLAFSECSMISTRLSHVPPAI